MDPFSDVESARTLIGAHRRARIARVADIAASGSVDDILAVLNHRDPELRIRMTRALGPVEDERLIARLIDMLRLPHGPPDYRHGREAWEARDALLGSLSAAAPQLRVALGKEDGGASRSASRSLSEPVVHEDVLDLVQVMAKAPRTFVHWAVGLLLIRVGRPTITTLARLAAGEDHTLHHSATWVLGQIVDEEAVEPLVRLLASCASDPRSEVADLAAAGLGRQKHRLAVEALVGVLALGEDRDDHGGLLGTAVAGLRAAGSLSIGPLVSALRDDRPAMRFQAASVLGDLRAPQAVDPLLERLASDEPPVRGISANALGKICDPRSVESLFAALDDADVEVRWAALWALAAFPDSRIVERLITVLRGPTYRFPFPYSADHVATHWKLKAQRTLEAIGEPAVEPLIRTLAGGLEPAHAKSSAAEALGRIGDRRAVPPLIAVAVDSYGPDGNLPAVRKVAIEALVRLGSSESIAPLLVLRDDQNLWDTEAELRLAAEIGLESLAGSEAITQLHKARESSDPDERDAAEWALERLGIVGSRPDGADPGAEVDPPGRKV